MQNHKGSSHEYLKHYCWSQNSHIMFQEIGNRCTDNAFRESPKSKEDPSNYEHTKISIFQHFRLILKISKHSSETKEHIGRVMNKQDDDSASQSIHQIWEENQKDCHTMMQKHLPELGSVPLIHRIINQSVQVTPKLYHVKPYGIGIMLRAWESF